MGSNYRPFSVTKIFHKFHIKVMSSKRLLHKVQIKWVIFDNKLLGTYLSKIEIVFIVHFENNVYLTEEKENFLQGK